MVECGSLAGDSVIQIILTLPTALLRQADFDEKLDAAILDPKSEDAKQLLRKLEPLIRITVEGEDLNNVVEQTSVLVKKVSAIIN